MTNDFIAAMAKEGIICRESIIADGEIHRFQNDKKGKNGWYVCYGTSGAFGDWSKGISFKWNGESVELSQDDYKRIQDRIEQARKQQIEIWESGKVKAMEFLEGLSVSGNSDYLVRKRVKSHGVLFHPLYIAIPIKDVNGSIWSYQTIAADGFKKFMSGGKVSGGFHQIGAPTDKVILCEGYATGATIYEQTGIPCIVCFNAGNIQKVAKSLPYKEIIIAADNDPAGIKSIGDYPAIVPSQDGYDWNDVYCEFGSSPLIDAFCPKSPTVSEFTYPPGMVGEIAKWITETAVMPQPKLSTAAAMAMVGAIKGHRFRSPTDLRTNVYILSVAPSGAGKDHPRKCVQSILDKAGLDNIVIGKPASGSGLLSAIQDANGRALAQFDEIGRLMQRMTDGGAGGYVKEIIDYMIEMYSSANTKFKGKQYSNLDGKMERRDINQPCLCINGSTVLGALQKSLVSTDVIDGFLNRWILIDSNSRPESQVPGDINEPPGHLISYITKLNESLINPEIPDNALFMDGDIKPATIDFTLDAERLFNEFREYISDQIITLELDCSDFAPLWIRAYENAVKVAIIIADKSGVTINDATWSIDFVKTSIRSTIELCSGISDNRTEAELKRVLQIIKQYSPITKNELTRKTQFLTPRRREEILKDLIESGSVVECEYHTGKRKKRIYKVAITSKRQ